MAANSEWLQNMEALSKELLNLMAGGKATEMLKDNLAKQEQMIDKLLETQKTTKHLIRGTALPYTGVENFHSVDFLQHTWFFFFLM